MNEYDIWLKHELEEQLGSIVREKISSLSKIDPETLDCLSDELEHDFYHSIEMVEFKTNIKLKNCDLSTLDRNSSLLHDISVSDSSKGRNIFSVCSSADGSPRNGKSQEYPAATERRGRDLYRSAGRGGQRMQALEVLLRVPVSDIVVSANWPQLQQELCESLCDDNYIVFVQVLKVLGRLSSSLAFSPVREGFLSLLEGLTLHYLTRQLHQQLPTVLHGIQLCNSVHQRIFLISHCLLQTLNEVSGNWIRYGEKRTQELLDNLVDLLAMHTHHPRTLNDNHSKDILYPFHIFSILDPEAKWCVCVMHAAFGRNILMKCILKSASLIRFMVEEIILWLKSQMKLSEGVVAMHECGDNGNINCNTVNMTVFLHCISLLQLFVDCDRGHLIFPVFTSIQEETVTVYSILLRILEFLNKVSYEPKLHYSEKLLRKLENICASLILSRGTRILHSSSVELKHLLLEVPKGMDNFSLHTHNINILFKISESPTAIRWMLGRPLRKAQEGISRVFSDMRISMSSASSSGRESTSTSRTACIARRVGKATAAAVRDRNRFTSSESHSPVCQLLSLSERLFSTPEGFLVLESFEGQLIPLAGNLFNCVRNMMYNSDPVLLSIQMSLESFLIGITLTPMGFMAVCGVDGILKCLIDAYLDSPVVSQCEEPRFLHLLQLSAFVHDVKLHAYLKNVMKQALGKLWAAQDIKSEWVWQEAKRNFMAIALSICSTSSAVSEMLKDIDQEDGSSESTLVEEIDPLSLKELLGRGLQPSNEASYLQEISLELLHALAHNVDVVSVLQAKLNLSESLQAILIDAKTRESLSDVTVQQTPRKDKSSSLIDETARSCNHIITIMTHVQEKLKDTFSCDVFASSKSPRSPRTNAHTCRPRVQSDMQRFLQDTRHGLHDNMWMSHARRAYRSSCRTELKVPMLIDLLDQVLQSLPTPALDSSLRWHPVSGNPSHPPKHVQAINMIVRYGCQVKALNNNMLNQHMEQLSILLHQSKIFLDQDNEIAFDWFTSSIFLMCAGNIDRCRSILQRVSMLPTGPFIWHMLSQNTMQLASSIDQQLQGLIVEYVPKVYNALQDAGVPWWLVVNRLTHQAFLPIMPLSQLPHIIALMALHSWEYNLYMHTAILAHVEPVLVMSHKQCMLSLLSELRLDNFLIGDYLPFMDKLAKLNRPHLVRDRITTATL